MGAEGAGGDGDLHEHPVHVQREAAVPRLGVQVVEDLAGPGTAGDVVHATIT